MKNMATYEPMLFGASDTPGVVAVEPLEFGVVRLFARRGSELVRDRVSYMPFMAVESSLADRCPAACERTPLAGEAPISTLLRFRTESAYQEARRWLLETTGETASSPSAPFLLVADPVQQFLLQTGITHFKGMAFEDLHRMQVDIECLTTAGYDFCNAEREGDRIIAIALAGEDGWTEVLNGAELDEKQLLERFVELVEERDPDVIEGHNLFNFDLPYLAARAARHGVKLALGRDGSEPRQRPGRFSAGERTLDYTRFDIHGRHVVDTLFLVQAYDVSHRSLDGFGLKAVARHFGIAAEERTYVEGGDISDLFRRDPGRLMDYARDDVIETRRLASLLSRSAFAQAQMLPLTYQNAVIRGSAARIDALMLREYLRLGASLPKPSAARAITGGYTDLFREGVIRDVHHCDVRSLYPSLMLMHGLGPASDHAGAFLKLLDTLRRFRLETKEAMRAEPAEARRMELDAMQATFKILINSFYGYLGFAQARFNDFGAADRVTAEGRELLRAMVAWLDDHGARVIEIDTDGIYYVPPPDTADAARRDAFRRDFAASLPAGIEIEFDGEYAAMFSYKMKNYALLQHDGEMIVKGAALKSRGLEPYQRDFMRRFIRIRLEGGDRGLPDLKREFDEAITWRRLPIESLARTEALSDSPAVYARKRDAEGGARRAVYELAIASGKEYRAGDTVSYYVTGSRRNAPVHENSKLVSDWDPARRDENVAYYQARLDALYEKLGGPRTDSRQGELF